jgi:cell division protein FtsW (lipid II flippase)
MGVSFFLFLVSLFMGFAHRVSFWPLLFRSIIVLLLSTVTLVAFFRFFNIVLAQFLAKRVREHRRAAAGALDEEDQS